MGVTRFHYRLRWALCGLVAFSVQALAGMHGPAVVELVDFTCAHCRAESTYVPRILRAVRAVHGRFEVAPIQPAPGAEPAQSVLAYYAELTAYPRDGVRAAAAIYAGYAQGAALAGARSTLSWLSLHGLPTRKAYAELDTNTPLRRWTRAVRLAGLTRMVSFPTFALIDQRTGSIEHVFTWHGHASRLTRAVVTYIERK